MHVIKTDGRSANDKANDWWLCWDLGSDLGIYRGQPLWHHLLCHSLFLVLFWSLKM